MKGFGGVLWLCAATMGFSAGVAIPIPIAIPTTGFVSMALIDTNGVLARNVAYAEPVKSGGHTFFWDGTDDLGRPVAPGTYTTRAVFFTNPPSLRYAMKVGTSGNPPWRTREGTGDWGGDLGGPSAIAANSTSLMVVWSAVENQNLPGIQQIDTNGNVLRIYTSFYPYDGRMAGAMDDTNFYLGILNRDAERIEIAEFELGTDNKQLLTILPTPPHYTLSGRWKNRWQSVLDGMAITSTRIFASVAADDRLFIIERRTGTILQEVSIPSPRGLAIVGTNLLAVSSNRVLKLTFDGVVQTNLIQSALFSAPYALAVDRSGNIYVSDGGSRFDPEAFVGKHQVFVFASDGSYLRSIGALGGSPRSGRINRLAFGDIHGLAIGPDDKLWVNEEITGFKRTSRWTTNGVLEREWFQRKLTHLSDLINPARSNELVKASDAFEDYPSLTAYSIDWSNGTWQPAWSWTQTYDEMFQEDVYLSNDHLNPLQELQPDVRHPVFHYDPSELVPFNGRNYFLNHDGNGDGAIFIYDGTNKPKPIALVGYHRVDVITNKVVSYYDAGPNQWFTWADFNSDGHMAMVEFTFTSGSAALALSPRMFDAKLETNLNIRLLRPIGNGVLIESVLPLKAMLPNGAPVYDWSMLQDLATRQMPDFNGGDAWKQVTGVDDAIMPLQVNGSVYALLDPENDLNLDLPSIDGFWANRNWRKKIAQFDRATGKFLWAAGRRAPDRAIAGEMYNPFALSVSHDTVFAADVLGVVWTWTTDGLYLGRLLNDVEPDRIWDEYAVHVEVRGPVTLFTNTITQKLYMIVNDTGAHVYEVSLPTLQSLPATTVNVTATEVNAARPWDPDGSIPIAGSVLSSALSGTNLVVSWHTNAAALSLQSAPAVTGTWANVSVVRQTNGAMISVTVPGSGTRQFYRLIK